MLKMLKLLTKIKGKIDFIYHLAGQSSGEKSYKNTYEDLEKNTSHFNLLDFLSLRWIFTINRNILQHQSSDCAPFTDQNMSDKCILSIKQLYQPL